MPLKDLLTRLAPDLGYSISSPQQRGDLISMINMAAKNLYDTNDLPGCLREQIFKLGTTDQQISFPSYVADVVAVRDYDSQIPITLRDMRPRYQTEGWFDSQDYYNWRIKSEGSPIERNWICDGPITFTLAKTAAAAFTIIVVGKTPTASKFQEIVAVPIGTKAVTTTNIFLANEIEAIYKSSATDEDITVTVIDGTIIATIPNAELAPSYTIVQVMDKLQSRGLEQLVEVLYKTRFVPFVNDYDTFPCGDEYEEAIYWQTLAYVWAKREGGTELAVKITAANTKCNDVLQKLSANKEGPKNLRMDFGINKWTNLFRRFGAYRDNNRRTRA